MKVTVDIPPDMERLLMKKCEEANVSPSEFIYLLLEWYFYKRQKRAESTGELNEFLRVAKEISEERVRYCKFSDGAYCAIETFEDVFSDKEPVPISPYRCLFCLYYVDRRKDRRKTEFRELTEAKMYDLAKIAAKFVVELYGDRLGYRPKTKSDKVMDAGEDEEKLPKKAGVKKLLDW
ncbi:MULTISPECIES: hypothetical protein [unclassified Archaeoglobus]|jgi:hypothetical protein|uniref:hypothetical protein n=1 Tax=unclassified Archaeoglobus TaxID=2643606 RepID=UPI0025C00CC4|nr:MULTISPECIES: hypothetical protein [unclassified Archaeoglobus]